MKFVALGALLIAILMVLSLNQINKKNHNCVSPCTVVFPNGTQEDEFKIDYIHGGTLKVWKEH